ncbi:MAG: DUF1499 domain-containing protein [Pseudomonadota bacterium]
MRKVLLWIIAALVVVFIAFALFVRASGGDQAFHFDPAKAEERGKQNDYIVSPTGEGVDMASPVFEMTPDALMARFKEVALVAPNTALVAERDGYATFVQRSKLMAYPDYVSVRAVEAEGGSALYVYSRARFGVRDFDVNKARVLAWLKKI